MMIMAVIQVRLIFSNAQARVGRRRLNCFLPTGQQVITLDGLLKFPVTMPSWQLYGMMIMELNQARLTCSNAQARVGRSKQNYFP